MRVVQYLHCSLLLLPLHVHLHQCPPSKRQKQWRPSSSELNNFFESLASCSTKPATFSVRPGYCEHFIPKSLSHDLPVILTSLYNSENLKLDYHDLHQASSEVNIMVSQEQVLHVEQQTRGQSCTRLWNRM